MNIRIAVWMGIAAVLGSCGAVNIVSAVKGEDYFLTIRDDRGDERFELVFESLADKPLCLTRSNWPNSKGYIDVLGDEVYVEIGGEVYPYKHRRDFGYCPGCVHKVLPGEVLSAFIPYSEFDLGVHDPIGEKNLHYSPSVYDCSRGTGWSQ